MPRIAPSRMFSASLAATSLGEWMPQKVVKTFRMEVAAFSMLALACASALGSAMPCASPNVTYWPICAMILDGEWVSKAVLLVSITAFATSSEASVASFLPSSWPFATPSLAFLPTPVNSW